MDTYKNVLYLEYLHLIYSSKELIEVFYWLKTVIAGEKQCFQTFKVARFALFKRIYLFKTVVALAGQYFRSCNTFGYYNGL